MHEDMGAAVSIKKLGKEKGWKNRETAKWCMHIMEDSVDIRKDK